MAPAATAAPATRPAAGSHCLCGSGLTPCTGGCVDVNSDPFNCGGCGRACAIGQVCSGDHCGCTGVLTICAGTCVDTTSDPAHCGGCGKACAAGRTCAAGACTCGGGETLCNGACVDLRSDPTNCGSCNSPCPAGGTCSSGACMGGGPYGCNGTYNCVFACGADLTCRQQQCEPNATANAIVLFNALGACFQVACPSALATDPCSMANPNYPSACAACQTMAIAAGGTCNAAWRDCRNDKP